MPSRRQHAQDEQHPARAGGARFQHLVRIDEEILAHGRHAERREHRGRLAQMLERSVETRWLRQHRHRGGAGARIGRDAARRQSWAGSCERARRRRAQLELGNDVEPERRQAQRRRGRCPVLRGARASPSGSRRRACGTRCALERAMSCEKPLISTGAAQLRRPAPRIARAAPSQSRARGRCRAPRAAVSIPAATEALRPAMYRASPHCSARAPRCAPRSRPRTPRARRRNSRLHRRPEILGPARRQAELRADRFSRRDTAPGVTSNARRVRSGVASSQPAAPCTTQARSIGMPAKVFGDQFARVASS